MHVSHVQGYLVLLEAGYVTKDVICYEQIFRERLEVIPQ